MKRLLILFFISTIIYGQSGKDFNVESFVINDSLTINDPVEKNLGRYSNYEIHLNKGDYFSVDFNTSMFTPLILLVSPTGNKFVFNSKDGKNIVFVKKINESGNWQFYVIGGENQTGTFKSKIGFADSISVKPQKRLSLCEFWNFISAHSKTNFSFINNRISELRMIFPQEFSKAKINFEKNDLLLEIGDNATLTFEKLENSIKNCLTDWNVKTNIFNKKSNGIVKSVNALKSINNEVVFIKSNLVEAEGKFSVKIRCGILN